MVPLAKAVSLLATKANPKKIVESIEAVSPEMREKLNRTFEQATADTILICHLVCKLVLSERLGIDASSEQANAMMLRLADDPKFAHRFYRLFGEGQKSSDRRRRAFLASVLYGLPDSKMIEDERERVDMAVERMTVPDVQFLALLGQKRKTPEMLKNADLTYALGPDGLGAVLSGTSLRIVTADEMDAGGNGFIEGFHDDPRFVGDRAALASLISLGCVDIGDVVASEMDSPAKIHHLRILPVGHMVLRALEEVGAGFAAAAE